MTWEEIVTIASRRCLDIGFVRYTKSDYWKWGVDGEVYFATLLPPSLLLDLKQDWTTDLRPHQEIYRLPEDFLRAIFVYMRIYSCSIVDSQFWHGLKRNMYYEAKPDRPFAMIVGRELHVLPISEAPIIMAGGLKVEYIKCPPTPTAYDQKPTLSLDWHHLIVDYICYQMKISEGEREGYAIKAKIDKEIKNKAVVGMAK